MGQENALPSLNHWSRISLLIFWPRMLLRCEKRGSHQYPFTPPICRKTSAQSHTSGDFAFAFFALLFAGADDSFPGDMVSDRLALLFVTGTGFVGGSGHKGSWVDEGCSDPASGDVGNVDVGKSVGSEEISRAAEWWNLSAKAGTARHSRKAHGILQLELSISQTSKRWSQSIYVTCWNEAIVHNKRHAWQHNCFHNLRTLRNWK